MKAVLVIDMPTSCEDCHLRLALDRHRCINTKENRLRWCGDEDGFYTSDTKPSWCPLRPLPKKKIVLEHRIGGYTVNGVEMTQAHGWNACLDAITGGEDETD